MRAHNKFIPKKRWNKKKKNQKWIIQIHWQYWTHKKQDEDKTKIKTNKIK
jgi:hypothetical protein